MANSRSHKFLFWVTVTSLQLCSCKDHVALTKNKADLEGELQRSQEEIIAYNSKIASVGQPLEYAAPALEAKATAVEKEIAALTQEVTELSAKAGRLEQALKTFRPKVEAYKAKHLR